MVGESGGVAQVNYTVLPFHVTWITLDVLVLIHGLHKRRLHPRQ